jgi:GNAT superfamily N-acetyltransferase
MSNSCCVRLFVQSRVLRGAMRTQEGVRYAQAMAWKVQVLESGDDQAIDAVRELWSAYWGSLGFPPEFQSFAEELRELPGKYSPPAGRLLLVRIDGRPVATAAFRPLSSEACEAKRLYVDPAYRHRGIAAALLTRLVEEARGSGYRTLFGDTMPAMASALVLYRRIGFVESGPYSENPTPGAVYLRLTL